MKKYIIDEIEYELLEEYKDGFDFEEFKNCMTDYYKNYDYILGDWAYGKLRLKGFCKKENNLLNNINDFDNKDDYIKNYCAYDCKYFVLKKN